MAPGLNALAPGASVGLLGGSFNPPHAGHLHISEVALRRLGLDRLVWLLSPGNPLKADRPAELERRMRACRELIGERPRLSASVLEYEIGTRYTVDTLAYLRERHPRMRFVWVMGADSMAGFHRWKDWTAIFELAPVAVLFRPGSQARAGLSPAARRFACYRLPDEAAKLLPHVPPPAWSLIAHPMSPLSSTDIRRETGWS